MSGPHARIQAVFRHDLPDPPDPAVATAIAGHTAAVLRRDQFTTVIVIGYGPGTLVTPITDVIRVILPREGIRMHDLLRVDQGRYWSYLCPACCPADGTPLSDAHPAAVTLTVAGIGALPSPRRGRRHDRPGHRSPRRRHDPGNHAGRARAR